MSRASKVICCLAAAFMLLSAPSPIAGTDQTNAPHAGPAEVESHIAPEPHIDPSSFAALRWRLIGPFRAGRVSAGAIDPADPNTYYFGTPGGGVWKSTNAGQTWTPIFDTTGMASIG